MITSMAIFLQLCMGILVKYDKLEPGDYGILWDLLNLSSGVGIFYIIGLYILSRYFRFCMYHRVMIYYIVINNVLLNYDNMVGINLDTRDLTMIYLLLAGLALLFTIYTRIMFGDRTNRN